MVVIKKIFFLFLVFLSFNFAFGKEDLSVVYIHVGETMPSYVVDSIRQARLYNPSEDIYLCGNVVALEKFKRTLANYAVKAIPLESLPKSSQHERFLRDTSFTDPFWIRTTERLLIVHDLIKHKDLKNVFHIESDIMIYGAFQEILPVFVKNYPSMAVPFVNDELAVCSILFLRHENAARSLADCIADHAKDRENDMRLLAILKEEKGTDVIDHLPIVPSSYVDRVDQLLFTNECATPIQEKSRFAKCFEEFSCIFDGSSFGVFLSRADKTICKATIFDPRQFEIFWRKDPSGFYVPYIEYQGIEYRLFNLHIHLKNLKEFRSNRKHSPIAWRNGTFIQDGL